MGGQFMTSQYKIARRRAWALLATASSLAITLGAGAAHATLTINGATDTVPGTFATPLVIDDGLIVGSTGTGELDVSSGAQITVTHCFAIALGYNAGGDGTLSIDGAGTRFNNGACAAYVGYNGDGTLSITNGGELDTSATNTSSSVIGNAPNTVGAATVDGAGSIWNFAGLVVGGLGTGTLTVSGGATLSQTACSAIDLGYGAAGKGTITITGAGTQWLNPCSGPGNLFNLGDDGQGTINVTSGAVAHGGQTVLGVDFDGVGALNVTGAGSQYLSNNAMTVGQAGQGTLYIANGGLVTDTGATIGGPNSSATVDGVGSTWTTNVNGSVNLLGITDDLTVSNGGVMSSGSGSNGGFITIKNAGSRWTIANGFSDGGVAGSGYLNIVSGGVLSDANGAAASGANSNASIFISDPGSTWTNTGPVDFGGGSHATFDLMIQNSGSLTDTTGQVETGSVTARGAGSIWSNSGDASVGTEGVGQVYLQNGGALSVGGGTGTLNLGGFGFGQGQLIIGGSSPIFGPGTVLASTVNLRTASSEVIFDHSSSNYAFAPVIAGIGQVDIEAGLTDLTGISTYTGSTNVSAGATLIVDGGLGHTAVQVQSGGALGGSGGILGAATIGNGGALIGVANQTLTTQGLTLSPTTNVDVSLSGPSTITEFQILNGALVLDGTLNITDAGGFGPGLYRLFTYSAGFTDNGLTVGSTPSGVSASDLTVQTSVANQVNLIYTLGGSAQFWDGPNGAPINTVAGGAGTWNLGSTNWTDSPGSTNGAWLGGFATFEGAPGVVTIDNGGGAVTASGLQFAVDGYSVGGGTLTLTGASPDVRVGDGTGLGAAYTAIIGSVVAGSTGLVKTDLGKLILTGHNTFTGGLAIDAGAVQVGADANLGDPTNAVSFAGGNLIATSSFATSRAFNIASGANIVLGGGVTLTDHGAVTGSAALNKTGAGLLILDGASSYHGAATVSGGELRINATFAGGVTVASGATLSGGGTIAGAVTVNGGGVLAGAAGQTLASGALSLSNTSSIDVALGAPSAGPLFQVNGNLTLDGVLNITNAGGFGQGVYGLIDYTGSLTDNGLTIGATPPGTPNGVLSVQTGVANQVNLIYTAAAPLQFWNGSTLAPTGTIVGGAGTWKLGPTNWTDAAGANSGAWPGGFGVFLGAPGVVTVDNSGGGVTATGLQFAVDGYSVGGGTLTLTGGSPDVRVGDGTANGAGYTATIGAVVAGSGLIKTDLGTLVLTGANTYAGGATIAGGTLSVSADANFGAAGTAVTLNGGNLSVTGSFASGRDVVMATTGAINIASGAVLNLTAGVSGAGPFLNKTGAGQLTLSGASSYSGAVSVNAGTLEVDSSLAGHVLVQTGGTLRGDGSIAGPTAVDGALVGVAGQQLTFNSLALAPTADVDVSLGAPSASALFVDNGALTLDGALNVTDAGGFGAGLYRIIDYTGALTDNGLDIGTVPNNVSASNLAVQTSIAGQVNLIYSAGALQFWNGATVTPAGTVVGGSGTWNAGADNWTDSGGSATGPWTGTIGIFAGAPGTVTVDNAGGAVNAQDLQFAVDGYVVGGGALTLTGPAPTIRVGDGTVQGGGDTATISAVLAGSNGLIKTDLGTLVLSGANTFTGGVDIEGGKLSVGADANLGAASGNLILNNAGALEATASFASARGVNLAGPAAIQTDAGVLLNLSGPLSGAGVLDKTGAGELELGGVSSYNGLMSADAGVLRIDGAVGGGLLVQSGARLQGVGQANNVSVLTGATFAPGDSIGTFTVAGGLTFQAGSTYEVELNAQGQSDLTIVSGATAIQGGVVHAIAAPGVYALGEQYTMLVAAGGGSGAFTGLTQNLTQPFLQLALAYDPTHVYLDVVRNSATFCSAAATRNQCAAANGAESLTATSPVYLAIADLPDAASARTAFDAVSGEVHPSMAGVQIEDSRLVRDAALGRARGEGDGRMVWGQVFGAQGSTGGDGDAAGLSRSTGGVLFGLETPEMNGWRLGALGGYDQTRVSIGARSSSATSDDYHLGAYAGLSGGMLAARFGGAYAWHEVTTNRMIGFTGYADAAHSSGRAETGQLFGEAALPLLIGKSSAIEPFAGVALVSQHDDGVTETGGPAALKAASAASETTFATAGLRGQAKWSMDKTVITFRGSLAWRGAYGDVTPHQNLSFAGGGSPFTIEGAPIARSAVVLDADLGVKVSDRARLSLIYDGQASQDARDQSLKLGLSVGF
jgi:fibronectin-binding autotransporter adhesin